MQTIGERLEDARKKKGISIREAAEATKVRGDYLQKFENNQFDIGLTEIYVRGFLRNYASYLKLPSERILGDYASLGHDEPAHPHPRQPSREVYGRMELSSSAPEDRAEAAGPADAGADSARQQPRIPRSPSVPATPILDQAMVYKAGIGLLLAVALIVIVWGAKAILGGSSAAPRPAAAPAAVVPLLPEPLAISALADVRVKVARQSDGAELYQGPMAAGERREFPNVALRVTATALESLRIEYKGTRYSIGKSGYGQTAFDFSGK